MSNFAKLTSLCFSFLPQNSWLLRSAWLTRTSHQLHPFYPSPFPSFSRYLTSLKRGPALRHLLPTQSLCYWLLSGHQEWQHFPELGCFIPIPPASLVSLGTSKAFHPYFLELLLKFLQDSKDLVHFFSQSSYSSSCHHLVMCLTWCDCSLLWCLQFLSRQVMMWCYVSVSGYLNIFSHDFTFLRHTSLCLYSVHAFKLFECLTNLLWQNILDKKAGFVLLNGLYVEIFYLFFRSSLWFT